MGTFLTCYILEIFNPFFYLIFLLLHALDSTTELKNKQKK